ncbi:uncharacterized protein LOC110690618 [Chenopodium quinoa]|uniref:uncharacterized protein LOC110690618 n=1 Tax=Chenopodium quinoa TaxID=63459 RepID=UPI000B78A448|nr:uncharacterized protein LOC110690618 [Chenopodium quinoa]
MAENRTLRELTAPNLNQQPLCIAYQQLEEGANVEIKSGLIHLLPAFHGMKASGGGLVNKTPGDATRLIAELAENSRQFSQRTPTRRVNAANSNTTELESQNLESQVSQISSAVSRLEAKDSGKLPSQTELNPKQQVNAITLRNGKELQETAVATKRAKDLIGTEEQEVEHEAVANPPTFPSYEPTPPFPEALQDTRRYEKDKDIYETFSKCEVNIPLLNVIKRIPRFAKFMKELCTIKRKHRLGGKEKVKVSAHVSAVFQKKIPEKCGDPGMFIVPVTIGDTTLHRAMLDLGASINVIPYSLFKSLKLGPLHGTGVVIQLADRSNVYPKGVVEDVLVKVDGLIFPADFYVLDMEHDKQAVPILLGRPFLKTAKTKIDVSTGSLTMEVDGKAIGYNIYDSIKYPVNTHSLCSLNVVDPMVHDVPNNDRGDEFLTPITNVVSGDCLDFSMPTNVQVKVGELNEHSKLPPIPPGSTIGPSAIPSKKLSHLDHKAKNRLWHDKIISRKKVKVGEKGRPRERLLRAKSSKTS